MKAVLAAAFLLLLSAGAHAQTPSDEWHTIATGHFRVHYPSGYEAWAGRAAERLESIREVVSAEIGYLPPQTVDVVVTNPVAEANGSAWPLLDTPRMIFFTEPPGPDEVIGAYGHWIDLLAVHETAHLVHMLRPSRNPLTRLLEGSFLPLNRITLGAPRWVLEGYATTVEGRLTGAGRPSSTLRALILRRWAESGRLPTYAGMSSDRRFLGMSMAYLMGSAYLEWLEHRAGPGALRKLWARMTARERRSFEEAFTGVFGERPDRLYGEFVAELTASAMAIRREGGFVEGDLFQETPRASGDPAVSPDGAKLAFVIRDRDEPEKLVVWTTGPAAEEERDYSGKVAAILARDPQDVAPVRSKPLPREPLESLVMLDGGDIRTPRWTRDGSAIVFSHRSADHDGDLHWDLYRWNFRSVERITHLADVRDADPGPGGGHAIAVRSRFGASQLVRVDLVTGEVVPLNEPSIDVVYSRPRVSRDGRRFAWVAHREGRWSLYVEEEGTQRRIETDGTPSSAEWTGDGAVLVSLAANGFAELARVGLDGSTTLLTRSRGGAFDPAASQDGRIFFTSLEPDGFVLRVLSPSAPPASRGPADLGLVPAIPPRAAQAAPFRRQELPEPHPYGLGRLELAWVAGVDSGPGLTAWEAGLRAGDLLGRFDALLLGAKGSGTAAEGAALAVAWRGWPVELTLHGWSASGDSAPGSSGESGVELRAGWARRFTSSRLAFAAGASSDDRAFADAFFAARQVRESWRVEETLRLEAGDDGFVGAMLGGALRAGPAGVRVEYSRHRGDGIVLGGMPSSILPRGAEVGRVFDPALPAAAASGDEHEAWMAALTLPATPVRAFYRRHRIGENTIALAGIEYEISTDPFPILKLPALDLTAGAARVLDEPFEGETKLWLGMRWRP